MGPLFGHFCNVNESPDVMKQPVSNILLPSTSFLAPMKYFLAGLFLCFGLAQSSIATHIVGASVTYDQLSSTSIRVYQTVYYSCSGISPQPVFNTNVMGQGGSCTNPTAIGSAVFGPIVEVTPVCPGTPTTCTNPGSTIDGIQEQVGYQDYDVTGLNCAVYNMTYSQCCRSNGITSITSAGTESTTVSSQFTLASLASPNQSPTWNLPPVFYVWAYDTITFDQGATDPDGDSLVFSMADCQGTSGPMVYNSGYSSTAPLGAAWQVSLNPINGWMTLQATPGSIESTVLCIKVEEYRNGVKIGEVTRDMNLYTTNVQPTFALSPPTHTGMSAPTGGAIVIGDTVLAPSNSSFCVQLNSTDPTLGDTSVLNAYLFNANGAAWQFTDTSGGPAPVTAIDAVGDFCMTTPYWTNNTIYGTVRPNICFYPGFYPQEYTLIVGDTSLVWPGDANDDLIANNLDLLALGMGYGSTGSARSGATINWTGEFAFPWQDTIPGAIDLKHVDTDGSGVINDDDTLAIFQNYGLTHSKSSGANGTASDPPLIAEFQQDTFNVGDTIHVPIMLGDASVMATNVYGIAFSMNYDASLIDSASFHITFDNNWMGTSNSLDLSYDLFDQSRCDAAFTKTNQTAVSGMGRIGTAHFIIIDNIDGKKETLIADTLELSFSNVTMIGVDGTVIPVQAIGDQATVIDASTEIGFPNEAEVSIYPVPTHDQLTISAPALAPMQIEMFDLQGREILSTSSQQDVARIPVQSLPEGLYFLRISNESGTVTKRMVKQ